MADIEQFRDHIMAPQAGVLDPTGVHHEFVSGMHGQKLDFDVIPDDSPLYREWTEVAAGFIDDQYDRLPDVIVGVANGTNRVALDTARQFDGQVFGAVSEKDPENSKKLYLAQNTLELINSMMPRFVVVIEDVGTTGSNSVQVALAARAAGAQRVEVVTTWQRRPNLERLEEAGVPYKAIIKEALTTYTPEECEASGFCADGWEYIPRNK